VELAVTIAKIVFEDLVAIFAQNFLFSVSGKLFSGLVKRCELSVGVYGEYPYFQIIKGILQLVVQHDLVLFGVRLCHFFHTEISISSRISGIGFVHAGALGCQCFFALQPSRSEHEQG
jgi:hypothetical protein